VVGGCPPLGTTPEAFLRFSGARRRRVCVTALKCAVIPSGHGPAAHPKKLQSEALSPPRKRGSIVGSEHNGFPLPLE